MLARNIKEARLIKGFSQKQLGEKIGVLHNTISNYETGRVVPDANTLELLSAALEMPIEVLMKLQNPEHEIDARTKEERERDSALTVIEKQQDMLMEQQKTIAKLVEIMGREK